MGSNGETCHGDGSYIQGTEMQPRNRTGGPPKSSIMAAARAVKIAGYPAMQRAFDSMPPAAGGHQQGPGLKLVMLRYCRG